MSSCILKRFVLKRLNGLLDAKKDGVEKARAQVALWTSRTKAVCAALESLSAKLEDNQVTPEELEAAVAELKALVENWK